jgi:nucleotide-binding universal stress UspA family protein
MKRMRFLVPVDFSPGSENAAKYAGSLASASAASIVFLHVVTPPFDDDTFLAYDPEAVSREAMSKLENWAEGIGTAFNLSYECKIRVGGITPEIQYLADTMNIDFIIMGTHGTTAIQKLLYGSHTTEVIEKAPCPVLAIPEETTFLPYRSIVYATDYQSSDILALEKLALLAEVFGAAIDVVHIVEENESRATELSIISYFDDLIKEHISYPNISCRVFRHDNISKGIERFTQSVGGDIVALAMRKQGFLSKLIRGSITREFVTRSRVPIIAFHVHQTAEAGDF